MAAVGVECQNDVHPGKWVKAELVEPAGVSVTALAAHPGVTRQATSNVLNGNAGVSAEMAIRLENAFGVKADTLLRMQADHDFAEAREGEQKIEVGRLVPASAPSGLHADVDHPLHSIAARRGRRICRRGF